MLINWIKCLSQEGEVSQDGWKENTNVGKQNSSYNSKFPVLDI